MVEHEIVHLPERVLVGRSLCSFGCKLSVGVDVVQRQVPPDIADFLFEIAEELADDRLRLPAIRTLEVPVLDDRDGPVGRATNVVAFRVDVDVEVDERLGGSEQCADP